MGLRYLLISELNFFMGFLKTNDVNNADTSRIDWIVHSIEP